MWSVTAIAPSPASLAAASSTSTGVSQSPEWSVCMCRSTSISGRRCRRRRSVRVAARVVPSRGQLLVDPLDLLRVGAAPAIRASRRARWLSAKRRVSVVEGERSSGVWNEPTFSAREWRSAALDVPSPAHPANGSCTCTKSSGVLLSSSSSVRATSTGSARGRRVAELGTSSTSPIAITRGSPPSVPSSSDSGPHPPPWPLRRAAPVATRARAPASATGRGSKRDGPGATARSASRATCSLTSFSCASHG